MAGEHLGVWGLGMQEEERSATSLGMVGGGRGGMGKEGSGIHMWSLHDSTASLFADGACQVHSVLP